MVGRYVGLGALLVVAAGIIVPGTAGAGEQCGELLKKICVGCHESDRFCERLGAPDKEWQALIKRMVSNGAELEKNEVGPLTACLSGPGADVKKFCGK